MASLLWLLLFAVFSLLFTAVNCQSQDAVAMQELKNSINAPASLGWTDPDPCNKWGKVECSGGRVTKIQIGGQGLQGSLPQSISNLSSLQIFEVMRNSLTGPLPTFSGLKNLQRILLNDNNFTSIPSDFFTDLNALQVAYFDNNKFMSGWRIPDSLLSASSLATFSASNTNIQGPLPDFFSDAKFPSLSYLDLSFNYLEGPLPSSLATSIQKLHLNGQMSPSKLNGSISVLQNTTQLTQVWLHGNSFSGPIPDLSPLIQLADFSLRDNRLTGRVPDSFLGLSTLKVVNLTNNMLQGKFPVFKEPVALDLDPKTASFCLPDAGKECDPRVNALLDVVQDYGYPSEFAQIWKGNNPCSWEGISCDNGGKINVVIFQKKGLVGSISPRFANLTSLQKLVLSNNNLTGTIPDALTTLPNLILLDVSNNDISGKLPAFRNNVNVVTNGNVNFGKDVPSPTSQPGKPGSSPDGRSGDTHGSKSASGVVVGSVVGGVCALLGAGGLAFCLYRAKTKRSGKVQSPHAMVIHPRHSGSDDAVKITIAGSSVNGGASENYSQGSSGPSDVHIVEAGNMVISIQVLKNVTNNFSEKNILGRGGFGTVYKGELHDGTQIAVKRMESGVMSEKGLDEFKSEISVLTKVRHRHLVTLLGYCLDGNERLLVYEYMPQGTLSRFLFNWKEEGMKPLPWAKRLAIALDVARGVEYLHSLAQQSFIHRDLKPSNILLGDDMRAKVADFGLVRLAPDGKASVATRLAGTFGYLAPEYAVTGRVSTKIDVFSFGVILMETITGRKALDENLPEESQHLVPWFRRMLLSKETFHKAIDPDMDIDEETLASISTVAELAGHCSAREPYQRPDMGHAVNVLSSLAELWKPSEPADPDDIYGIDYDMTLPQAVKKWQALEGMSGIDSSSVFGSNENTQTSIPTRPSGFADSFTSSDGR